LLLTLRFSDSRAGFELLPQVPSIEYAPCEGMLS